MNFNSFPKFISALFISISFTMLSACGLPAAMSTTKTFSVDGTLNLPQNITPDMATAASVIALKKTGYDVTNVMDMATASGVDTNAMYKSELVQTKAREKQAAKEGNKALVERLKKQEKMIRASMSNTVLKMVQFNKQTSMFVAATLGKIETVGGQIKIYRDKAVIDLHVGARDIVKCCV